jgi:hypothetical protein
MLGKARQGNADRQDKYAKSWQGRLASLGKTRQIDKARQGKADRKG